MRVILKVVSGPSAGRKFWLRPGDYTEVGSGAGVDFSIKDSTMARIQFTLDCDHTGCRIRDAGTGKPTLVNGAEVGELLLKDGDSIGAGESQLEVTIEGKAAAPAELAPTLVKIDARRAADVCALYLPDERAQALLAGDPPPDRFLELLGQRQHWLGAIEFLAHALPKREAVWWCCRSIRATLSEKAKPAEADALDAAELWVRDPNDDHRRATPDHADSAGLDTPAGLAALSVFYSGGSLAPPDLPEVPPQETLTAKMVNGALLLASVSDNPAETLIRREKFTAEGIQIARGAETWIEG